MLWLPYRTVQRRANVAKYHQHSTVELAKNGLGKLSAFIRVYLRFIHRVAGKKLAL